MRLVRPAIAAALAWLSAWPARAQRFEYPPAEFAQRRAAVMNAAGEGLVLVFGATMPIPGVRFRQDNDFFYLTGNEDMNAALVLDVSKKEAHLFLPAQNEAQLRVEGANWLQDPQAATTRGFTALHPLPYLEEFLARRRTGGPQALWVRLSERDEVDLSRGDKALYLGRRQNAPFGGQPSEDAWRVSLLRERYPFYELRDVSPLVDRLRVIKTAREIEALRRNAWHYQKSSRQLRDGDLVVMDYGASVGYQTIDITRTWPVSGKFDDGQLRAYRCVLEAQKAVIAAMRPGATRDQTREVCRAVFQRWGFADQRPCGAGHFVGMAVHDVGDSAAPFAPGMVIAVEPIIEDKARALHVRIEDTVLVTTGEPEVLSAGVPKEVDEVLALVGSRSR